MLRATPVTTTSDPVEFVYTLQDKCTTPDFMHCGVLWKHDPLTRQKPHLTVFTPPLTVSRPETWSVEPQTQPSYGNAPRIRDIYLSRRAVAGHALLVPLHA